MIKVFTSIFSFLSIVIVHAQETKSNSKNDKDEIEIAVSVVADKRVAIGGQAVFRFYSKENLKMGIGGFYAADFDYRGIENIILPYGVTFGDIVNFFGANQKWSVGGQIGYGFYNRELGGGNNLKGGMYYSILCSYRASISEHSQISISPLISLRSFRYVGVQKTSEKNAGIGVKIGIVL